MGKWLQISELVYADLAAAPALTTLLSNAASSIYPLMATADEGDSFIVYSVGYEGKPSKDGVYAFSVTINAFADTYNKAIAIADEVTAAITASNNIYSIGAGRPVFNDQDEFYLEQTFNIKK
jgi:hypothetical protein